MVATPPEVLSPLSAPIQYTRETEKGYLDIDSILGALKRRRLSYLISLALITAAVGARTVYERVVHPVYEGSYHLLIKDPLNEGTQSVGGNLEYLARNTPSTDIPTLIQVLQSPAVLNPVFLGLQRDGADPADFPAIAIAEIGRISRLSQSTGVLEVKATGPNPDMLRKGLELSEQAHLGWATKQRQQRLSVGLEFLENQEPRLRATNQELQSELQRFRELNTVIEPTEEAVALRNKLEQLKAQLLSQQGEQRRLGELRSEVASGRLTARNFIIDSSSQQLTGGAATSATGGGSLRANLPSQSQLDELQRLEQEIAVAEANFKSVSPVLTSLRATRDSLLPKIQSQELEAVDAAQRQNANAMITTQAQLARLAAQFRDQPELLKQYETLQQRVEIARSNLQSYLQSKDQFQLELAQESSPWSVISPIKVSGSPVEPSILRGLVQGLLLGLVGGAGVVFVRERMDPVFHTSKDARNQLNLPLLGHIPYIAEFDGVETGQVFPVAAVQQSQLGEALRNLCTSLRFLRSEHPLQSLLITSSSAGEGKSLVTVLLAQTLSELGQRVLLVDADLRQPKIHQRLGLDNEQGLSTLLSEAPTHWRDAIQEIPAFPGWSVLTSGPGNPDPARLVGSESMHRLVQDIAESKEFDLVLYDAPPVLYFADTALVTQHMQGVVLLVGLNQTNRELAMQSMERIQEVGTPLLGFVSNSRIHNPEEISIGKHWARGYPSL